MNNNNKRITAVRAKGNQGTVAASKAIVAKRAVIRDQEKVNDADSKLVDVMKAIMAPGLPSKVRYIGAGISGPTSVSQLAEPVGVSFGTADGELPAYEFAAFVFRDPVRHTVFYDPNEDSKPWNYNIYFQVRDGIEESTSAECGVHPGPLTMAYAKWTPDAFSPAIEFKPHGETLSVGLSNGHTYIWLDLNSELVAAGSGVAADIRIYINKWTPRGDFNVGVYDGSFNAIAGPAIDTIQGYIRFEMYTQTTAITAMDPILPRSIRIHGSGPVWCHKPLLNYAEKAASVEKIRVLSAGLLFTNTTPAIARGGKIATKQLPGEEPWYEYANGGFDALARTVHADVRDASDGVYGYLKPTTLADFEMTDDVDSVNNYLIKFAFNLDSVRAYLATYAVMPAQAGQSAQLTTLTNIEFESDDQWYQQSVSEMNPELFALAMRLVSRMEQYDENPLHLKDAMAAIHKAAKVAADFAVKYGPTAVKIGSLLASVL